MPTLVLVQDQFVKLTAMAGKVDSLTVCLLFVVDMNMAIGATAILSMLFTLMMLESDAKVTLHRWICKQLHYIMRVSVNYCNSGIKLHWQLCIWRCSSGGRLQSV